MKKIVFITTARSEYNASRWVIKAINDDPELELILVSAHNDNSEIIDDGYNFDYLNRYNAKNNWMACHSLGEMIWRTSNVIDEHKPDLLIINGDRIELMSIVSAASTHGIPIAHIGGGDITDGSLDNETRYAISRYSHLHFVSDKQAAENLIKSGEEPWRVSVTGQCGLENIIRTEKLSLEETSKAIGIDLSIPTAVCIYYPSRELNVSVKWQIDCILEALENTETQTVFIYSCSEIGSDIIKDRIDKFCKREHVGEYDNKINFKAFANLKNQLFQSLLHHSAFMIGNSSCGIIEYPFTGKRTLNIGSRQKGRYQYPTIINSSYSLGEIMLKIGHAQYPADGGCICPEKYFPSKKIIQVIKENIDKPELLHKRILL